MPTKKLINLSLILLIVVLASFVWAPAHAQEMTCPEPTPVVIDIKPGSNTNPVNLSVNGLLPVAVLTTADFNASSFVPEMAHLNDANTPMSDSCSGATAVRWKLADVNQDGKKDLVFFFQVQDLNFTAATTMATFMAHGSYGGVTVHIMGMDAVSVVP